MSIADLLQQLRDQIAACQATHTSATQPPTGPCDKCALLRRSVQMVEQQATEGK